MLQVDVFLQHPLWHCLLLVLTCWIAYWDILKGTYVSDDWDGVARQDGKFKHIDHPVVVAGSTPAVNTLPPHGGSFWNDVLTWIRWHVGKSPNPNCGKLTNPADINSPRDTRQYIPNPLRHHRLSLIIFSGTSILVYSFLSTIVGESVAFLATLLWIAHPVGVQTVGWISGIGYVLAAFFMFLGLNAAVLIGHSPLLSNPTWTICLVGLYALCQFLAFRSQFTSLAVVVIMCYLRLWPFALIAGLIAAMGLARTIMEVVSVRARTFKQQQMGASTRLHPKKIVVIGKTIYYYCKLAIFPKRLGLYHTYGYHYPMPWIEWEDRYFWAGVALAATLGASFFFLPAPIPFAILWWFSFLIFVLNWITVHQFVAERYVWIPVIGVCLVVASFAPPWLYWLLFGLALMRTWAHLPTYFNELMFYQSNVWNHPTSEVAYGNLGVTYLRMQLPGSAVDTWNIGGQVNQDYDVNWYNLYSLYRGQGLLEQAHQFMLKALSCTTCHFPKEWRDELNTLELEMQWQRAMVPIPNDKKDAWQQLNLENMLKDPKLPYRPFWENKYKLFKEYLAKKPPVPPVIPPVVVVPSMPPVTATT